jgi:hypothetical protein
MWFAFLCMGILLLPQCVLGVMGSTRYGVPEREAPPESGPGEYVRTLVMGKGGGDCGGVLTVRDSRLVRARSR